VEDIRGHVPLAEAAATFCYESGMTGPYSLHNLDLMAITVARLCPVYLGSSADQTISALTEDHARGGRFADGGKRMVFSDGRPALEHLFVTRTALRAALALITRSGITRSGEQERRALKKKPRS
jgi:hypothetical protein